MNNYVTGAAIRTLREKQHLTQAQLAERISVSDKTVSKRETWRLPHDDRLSLCASTPRETPKRVFSKHKRHLLLVTAIKHGLSQKARNFARRKPLDFKSCGFRSVFTNF